jgi:hypothetical protein
MSHKDLVSRIKYELYGPGHGPADTYWATVAKV